MSYDLSHIERIAQRCADAARAAILPHFRQQGLTAENKETESFDPVTVADRAAEQAMRAILTQECPDDAILGEEFGNKPGTTGLTWVLDPIDGTRGFISGTPTWGVLIGVTDPNGVIFGLIDQPYIQERFVGHSGQAWVNGPMGHNILRARPAAPLSDAIMFTTFPEVGTQAEGRAFHAVAQHTKLVRYGCDCYGYALVAAGQIDLVIEAQLKAYDVCGPIGVVEGAGGLVTNWQGEPAHNGGQIIAAANADIHAEALRILKASE
ncbi:MAG: histidinol-phosphatase [Aliishimia sp.]